MSENGIRRSDHCRSLVTLLRLEWAQGRMEEKVQLENVKNCCEEFCY